ncbi:MAG: hypothetical protein ACRBB6_02375 [Neptuniibacter sp.]
MSCNKQNRLELENERFADSGGISQNNATQRFMPAFKNKHTGEIALSRYANGATAPFHLIEGLPENWLKKEEKCTDLEACIISGFVRFGQFFDRQEAADFMEQAS